ncbi:MAG TPA: dienelactone hydrolase family protein [Longimicrobiales bacterium]|nr:dienelactone hydrolase family protein [Longimicrobiales bacterium]
MLETDVLHGDGGPAGPGGGAGASPAPVLVLMHGRGADPSDLAPLRRFFPAAVTVVLARAPFEAARWGYGPGWAWYLHDGDDRPETKSFRRSQHELEALVHGMADIVGAEPGPVFLGGFSQGGTMSLGYALRRRGDVAGVINFSGFVPDHPDIPLESDGAATPVFWGHGTADPAIPFTLAVRGRERLRAAALDLEARDYAMGHGISPDELRDASRWLEGVLGTGGP